MFDLLSSMYLNQRVMKSKGGRGFRDQVGEKMVIGYIYPGVDNSYACDRAESSDPLLVGNRCVHHKVPKFSISNYHIGMSRQARSW